MVKLKGCHFIHESMLYFVQSSLLFKFVRAARCCNQYSGAAIMRNRSYTFLKFPLLSPLVNEREMRSQVWIYQSLCAARSSSASENAQNGTKAIRLSRINGYLLAAVTH